MKKLVIFDFDGTLADTNEVSYQIYAQMCERYKVPLLTPEELHDLKKLPVKERLKTMSVPLYKVPKLVRESWDLYYDYMDSVHYFEGIEDLLRTLHLKGITTVIVSSNHKRNIEAFLTHQTVNHFSEIYGKARVFGKERLIKKVLKRHKVAMQDALYVGDEIRDIEACLKLDMPIASVTWGFDRESMLKKLNPNGIAKTTEELRALIFETS